MASYYLCPLASFLQLFTDAGIPLNDALIWTYQAGTSTPTTTWTDITGGTPNANPIQLNSAGRLNNVNIWQQGGVPIKLVFSTNSGTVGSPVFGTQIGPTWDQISGINDPTGIAASLATASGIPSTGPTGAFTVANAVCSFATVTAVRASYPPTLVSGQTLVIAIEGSSVPGDGGGGLFYWNATSASADDGISVIKPTTSGNGRYLRFFYQLSGSFTATLTGCTTSPTVTVNYSLTGGPGNGVVVCNVVGAFAVSNSTSLGLSNWAVGLQGLTTPVVSPLFGAQDNSALGVSAYLNISAVGGSAPVITINNASGNWTNSGNKGIESFSFSYVLK